MLNSKLTSTIAILYPTLAIVTILYACAHDNTYKNYRDAEYFSPRVDYLQCLEPRGNRILFGAAAEYDLTFTHLISNRTTPLYYSFSYNLSTLPNNWYITIDKFLTAQDKYILLQLDIHIRLPDGNCYDQAIADGFTDRQLHNLETGLKYIGRPTLLRFAPEFNSTWSNCDPQSYRRAWQRMGEIIRQRGDLAHVALIWTATAGGKDDILSYFPGDNYVDWWSLEIHTPSELHSQVTHFIMTNAVNLGYPILLGTSTPGNTKPKTGDEIWTEWLEPLFTFLRLHPSVKAFTYNDWINLERWGDPILAERFHLELSNPIYEHANNIEALKWFLDIDPPR